MDNNNIFPNKIPNFTKFSQIEIFPKFTKCSQDGILKGFPRIPSKSFPKLIFQNCANVPNKFAHRNIFKNTPNMAYKTFPTNLGRNIPNRIFPTKILKKLILRITISKFSQQQILQKLFQSLTKSSKIFPIKNKFFPISFSNFPKNQTI